MVERPEQRGGRWSGNYVPKLLAASVLVTGIVLGEMEMGVARWIWSSPTQTT